MKAIRYYQYGPPGVLKLEDADTPAVGEGEVLIRVAAASVNPLDFHFMRGTPYLVRLLAGLRRPRTSGLGVDLAGQVAAVGKRVTGFSPGDQPAKAFALSPLVSQTLTFFIAQPRTRDLALLSDLLLEGKITPVIDRTYPLSGVREAVGYLEEGHAKGKVVITV